MDLPSPAAKPSPSATLASSTTHAAPRAGAGAPGGRAPLSTGRAPLPHGPAFGDLVAKLRREAGASAHASTAAAAAPQPAPLASHRRAHEGPRTSKGGDEVDPLDPAARRAMELAPPMPPIAGAPLGAPPPPAAIGAAARDAQAWASLEALIPSLVRRIAWSGDARRGAVRMELGEGALAGGALLVQADGGRVHVRLEAPAGVDGDAWGARIAARLAARGIPVDGVDVA